MKRRKVLLPSASVPFWLEAKCLCRERCWDLSAKSPLGGGACHAPLPFSSIDCQLSTSRVASSRLFSWRRVWNCVS